MKILYSYHAYACILLCCIISTFAVVRRVPLEARLSTSEIIVRAGYPVEDHYVRSEDNYILNLQRIPFGLNDRKLSHHMKRHRPVVLLVHGITVSSDTWVFNEPNESLAFLLADRGYDVWLGNVRGNLYSRNHTYLNPYGTDAEAQKFWNYSLHEIGLYDVPACIDYIVNTTGHQKMYYMGHSEGTTVFYIAMSSRPEYNERIIAHFSLAPAVYFNNTKSFLFRLFGNLESNHLLSYITSLTGHFDYPFHTEYIPHVIAQYCQEGDRTQYLCSIPITLTSGYNPVRLNRKSVPLMLERYPAGCSSKQIIHFSQFVATGLFRPYDYGEIGNLQHYGRYQPPLYNLSNVKCDIHLLYGFNDWIIDPVDNRRLARELPNLKNFIPIADPNWGHNDFVYGLDARRFVYDTIFDILENEYGNY